MPDRAILYLCYNLIVIWQLQKTKQFFLAQGCPLKIDVPALESIAIMHGLVQSNEELEWVKRELLVVVGVIIVQSLGVIACHDTFWGLLCRGLLSALTGTGVNFAGPGSTFLLKLFMSLLIYFKCWQLGFIFMSTDSYSIEQISFVH